MRCIVLFALSLVVACTSAAPSTSVDAGSDSFDATSCEKCSPCVPGSCTGCDVNWTDITVCPDIQDASPDVPDVAPVDNCAKCKPCVPGSCVGCDAYASDVTVCPDSMGPPDVGDDVDAAVPFACEPTATGAIPGAHFDLSQTPCQFSIAAAKGAFPLPYRVVVESSEHLTLPTNAGQCQTDQVYGNVGVFERLDGNGQTWCMCDTGLCAGNSPPLTTVPGTYDAKFVWDGKNFQGPSDTMQQPGAPFPPGLYQFHVRSSGQRQKADGSQEPYAAEATLRVRLDP